ncbi:MAG: TolC family protein [Polyangiales bacterium]
MNLVCNSNGRLTALLLALLGTLTPGRAAAEVVTLQELEDLALQNQQLWEQAEANAARTGAEADAARAETRPTFWMTVAAAAAPGSYIEQVRNTVGKEITVRASPTIGESGAFHPRIQYDATIGVSAPLYDGRARAAIKAAEAYQSAAHASSEASRQSVLMVVRASYLDWLANHLVHVVAATSAQDAKAQRERTESRVAVGDRPRSELDAALYEELETELVAAGALANAATAKRILEAAVGVELSPEAEPDVRLLEIEAMETGTDDGWEAEALERQSEAARQEANMHRRTRMPTLAAIGQTGLAGVNDRAFPMYRIGLNLTVPFWDGGRALALSRAAEAQAAQIAVSARDAHIAKDDERKRAMLDRTHAEEQLAIANSLVSISEKRVEQARTSYELGATEIESVSALRATLRDAQSRRIQIQVARADAILRLQDDSVAHGVLEP